VLHSGRVDFGEMEVVVFGRRAAEVVAEGARQREAEGVFLMTSGTLNRTTDNVAKVRGALGNWFAGLSTGCRRMRRGAPCCGGARGRRRR
jgi:maleylacetate reductase